VELMPSVASRYALLEAYRGLQVNFPHHSTMHLQQQSKSSHHPFVNSLENCDSSCLRPVGAL
jgi:hypothetical protein